MKAMILAAGLGTRLRPLTADLAKPSLPVVNVPLIVYNLYLLKKAGVKEVMINLHHAPDSIRKLLGRGRKYKMKIHYSFEPEILGTGGGLKNVEDFLRDDTFILMNGDIICEVDLEQAVQFHHERDALATMVVRADKAAERFGVIGIDEENRIRRFTDAIVPPPGLKKLRKMMFTGIHILSPQVFEYLPPSIPCCINKYAYPRMIENNEGVYGYVTEGFWSDLGTISSYFQTNMKLLSQPSLLSYFDPLQLYEFAPKREVDRVIRMGRNVDLHEGVQLIDPVVLGDGTDVQEGSVIGPNVIVGPQCSIAKDIQIHDSILWPGTKIKQESETATPTVIQASIVTKTLHISVDTSDMAVKSAS